jgi:putative flippase GtrA
VTYARRLYERFGQLIHEVAKFGVVGVIAFLVTEIGTNLLHFQADLGPLTSNVIATAVATCVSFAGNRYWTFRHRDRTGLGREYVLFFGFNGIGLLIQLACLGFVYYALGMTGKLEYNIALFIGIALGTLFRFWSYRAWVWRALPPDDAAAAAGLATTEPPATGPGANGHLVGGPGHPLPPVRGRTRVGGHDGSR